MLPNEIPEDDFINRVKADTTEEYVRQGRYFEDRTMEGLEFEWNAALAEIAGGNLTGPRRAIMGVVGEFNLRGIELPDGFMVSMSEAYHHAFVSSTGEQFETMIERAKKGFDPITHPDRIIN